MLSITARVCVVGPLIVASLGCGGPAEGGTSAVPAIESDHVGLAEMGTPPAPDSEPQETETESVPAAEPGQGTPGVAVGIDPDAGAESAQSASGEVISPANPPGPGGRAVPPAP